MLPGGGHRISCRKIVFRARGVKRGAISSEMTDKAVDNFKNYCAGSEVHIFEEMDKEQAQLDELVKRFQSF